MVRTALAGLCSQGFPAGCSARPDEVRVGIRRTHTKSQGSVESAASARALRKKESSNVNVHLITDLYRKYASSLRQVRNEQRDRYSIRGDLHLERIASCLQIRPMLEVLGMPPEYHRLLKPQLDDVEAETTYLLLREFKPQTVVEIAPDGGWSTYWLLAALRDNGSGRLFSYDLFDHCTRTVPRELADGRWTFSQGDITRQLWQLPRRIDYLFMDCDHSAQFARWYLRELFPRLSPGTPISVHDIYPESFGESRVVREWLAERRVSHFTTAPAVVPDVYERLMEVKRELGLDECIHSSRRNPMVFFRWPHEEPGRLEFSAVGSRLDDAADRRPQTDHPPATRRAG